MMRIYELQWRMIPKDSLALHFYWCCCSDRRRVIEPEYAYISLGLILLTLR